MTILKLQLLTNILILLLPLCYSNTYNVGDYVPIYVNKIGPFNNPSETFGYYELPFCRPDHLFEKKRSLGEVLNGERSANCLYKLEFAVNKTGTILCQTNLNPDDVTKLRNAIKRDYYFQMYYDNLPLWAFIGKIEDRSWNPDAKEPNFFLFTHVQFDALYNGNQVIQINAFGDPNHLLDLTKDADVKVEFTYSVTWKGTATPYKNRMERYIRPSLEPTIDRAHRLSFINWIVIVFLLVGLVTTLFNRHLKNELKKWTIGDEDEEKEVGSKYSRGDLFRPPTNLPLFSAFVGCGMQLLVMALILSVLACFHIVYPYVHGALPCAIFVTYILTSAVAGYSSASLCSQHVEVGWERTVRLAAMLLYGPLISILFVLNTVATSFGVISALPLGTIFVIFLVFSLISIPLLVLGGSLGHRYNVKSAQPSPTVTKKTPREIPSLNWHQTTVAQMFVGGLLPFAATLLEFHLLCSTLWGYKIYTLNFFLTITFLVLLLITGLMSVCLTYFRLATEDHKWQWRSFLCGGATAIYMFAYSVHFYFRSNMSGILQVCFFFGYSGCMCFAFFLVLGTVSYKASSMFVRWIYNAAKND